MSLIVNKSARMISAGLPHEFGKVNEQTGLRPLVKAGRMFDFVPGILTKVDEKDLKILKKIPLIKRSFDNGDLVMGTAAKKIATEANKEIKSAEKADLEAAAQKAKDDEDLLDA